ncbi:MAG: orotidine-5'-phosphate decarboxylase, partial [Halobacteria archaeon]|nr:orotidine-5'-phosphate decarboxylase [Halobacteria archaeon]
SGFFEELAEGIEEKDSAVCVGLDPVPERVPDGMSVLEFNRRIIDATGDVAVAYKPNAAFYEALGVEGWEALLETIEYAQAHAPVVLDCKRGDIGSSSRRYAGLVDTADAVTVSPYMGYDSLKPFLDREDKGVFVLCRTTNSGAENFQELSCSGVDNSDDDKPLYLHVAERCVEWNANSNIGLVVGATAPDEMERVRNHADDLPFLVPGVGAQGGDVEAAVEHGLNSEGVGVVNSTRSIIYAHEEGGDVGDAAREAAKSLRRELNKYRS